MMKNRNYRKSLTVLVLAVCCIVGSSCSEMNDKPALKDLSLALAGMAGSDAVTFEGAAALMREGKKTPELSQYYGGKVEDHNRLSLYTLLPDQGTTQTAATKGVKELTGGKPTKASGQYSKLEKREGKWQELSQVSGNGEDNPLLRLNPLLQLEVLGKVDKTVKEESGAAKGTRVLRIELTPAAARDQLSKELEQEMAALRPVSGGLKAKNGTANESQADRAIEALWEKKNSEMKQKLAKANVKAVYHLTVDKKHNLPRKLDWTRTVSYGEGTSGGGAAHKEDETFVVRVNFYGYR
jgi:hypothetical protein